MKVVFKSTLIASAAVVFLAACSKIESSNESVAVKTAKTPEEAINRLITAYSKNDLEIMRQSLGSSHRFGSNIVDGLSWLGNCMKMQEPCLVPPIKVVEIKEVNNETVIAALGKNLLGAPMSVWFATKAENEGYKVVGMHTQLECALKTPEQKAKELKERKPGDYSICFS